MYECLLWQAIRINLFLIVCNNAYYNRQYVVNAWKMSHCPKGYITVHVATNAIHTQWANDGNTRNCAWIHKWKSINWPSLIPYYLFWSPDVTSKIGLQSQNGLPSLCALRRKAFLRSATRVFVFERINKSHFAANTLAQQHLAEYICVISFNRLIVYIISKHIITATYSAFVVFAIITITNLIQFSVEKHYRTKYIFCNAIKVNLLVFEVGKIIYSSNVINLLDESIH